MYITYVVGSLHLQLTESYNTFLPFIHNFFESTYDNGADGC